MTSAVFKLIKKSIAILVLIAFVFSHYSVVWASPGSLAIDYLCEIGKTMYSRGRYQEALQEFRKILMINPDHEEATYYVKLITRTHVGQTISGLRPGRKVIALLKKDSRPKLSQTMKLKEKTLPAVPAVRLPSIVSQTTVKTAPQIADKRVKVQEQLLRQLEKQRQLYPYAGISAVASKAPVVQPFPAPAPLKKAETELEEETVSPGLAVEALPKKEVVRKGEIGLFIDGEEVSLERPIMLKEGQPLIPLWELCFHLFYQAIDLKAGNFRLISPDGFSREISATLVDNEPMLEEKQISEYFSVETRYEVMEKALYLQTKLPPAQFKTYALEKSPEELKKEKQEQELLQRISQPPEKPTYIPESAWPSVDLRTNSAYTYIKYHTAPVYHSLTNSLRGRFYDFDLDFQSIWKDINGVFDHDYTWLKLTRPDLFIGLFYQYTDLYPLRGQAENFNGLKIIKGWDGSVAEGNLNTTFVGGNTENTISGSSGAVKYLGRIYGLKQEFNPLSNLHAKTGIYYLENEADLPHLSGTTSFPRDNIVTYSDLSLRLPYDFTVSAALGHCYYHPDNATDTTVQDLDWRTSLDWNKPRGRLGLAYEIVGDRYVSFSNPANYQDYKGWDLYGNYRITDKWSIYSNLNRYRNNVDNEDRSTNYITSFNFSSYHLLTKEQSVNLSFNRLVSDPVGPNATASSITNIYRGDYFFPFLFNSRGIANYQFTRADSGGQADHYAVNTGGSLFKSFGRGSSWYFSQQFTDTFYKTAADTRNLNTTFNINYVFLPVLGAYLNSNYTRNKTEDSVLTPTLSAAAGFRYQIFPLTHLHLEYNINSYNLKTEKGSWPRNWSILFYVSQGFDISSPLNFGIIEGRVVKDLDDNGRIDYSDPGIEGAVLQLEDRRQVITDSRGYFKFLYVAPGTHQISLDLSSAPAEWTLKNPEKEVEVQPRKKNKADFLLIKSSLIKGRVFVDANGDYLFQDTEEPLGDIAVELLPQNHFTRTNSEGEFQFDYLLPGKYYVRLSLEAIPLGYELVSQPEVALELPAGQEIKDINFVLRLKIAPASK